jgi:flavorubredoxin
MHFTRKVTKDLTWVGADDRRLACFEGVYGVPNGVSYNSYLLQDEKTVLFDTVDKAVYQTFFENVKYALDGRMACTCLGTTCLRFSGNVYAS